MERHITKRLGATSVFIQNMKSKKLWLISMNWFQTRETSGIEALLSSAGGLSEAWSREGGRVGESVGAGRISSCPHEVMVTAPLAWRQDPGVCP